MPSDRIVPAAKLLYSNRYYTCAPVSGGWLGKLVRLQRPARVVVGVRVFHHLPGARVCGSGPGTVRWLHVLLYGACTH